MALKTVKYRVKIDFPWSMHEVGEIISVYETTGMAYVVGAPDDYGNGYGQTEKVDLRDYPEIYELVEE